MNFKLTFHLFFLMAIIAATIQAEYLDIQSTEVMPSDTHVSQLSADSLLKAIIKLSLKVEGLEEVIINKTMPIGFIYVQLPNQKSPKEIWSKATWKDVSSEYANLFFRVEGNKTAAWGQIQEASAPRILEVLRVAGHGYFRVVIREGLSDYLYTGDWAKERDTHNTITFNSSINVEVKPQNMAMRIWKRIE